MQSRAHLICTPVLACPHFTCTTARTSHNVASQGTLRHPGRKPPWAARARADVTVHEACRLQAPALAPPASMVNDFAGARRPALPVRYSAGPGQPSGAIVPVSTFACPTARGRLRSAIGAGKWPDRRVINALTRCRCFAQQHRVGGGPLRITRGARPVSVIAREFRGAAYTSSARRASSALLVFGKKTCTHAARSSSAPQVTSTSYARHAVQAGLGAPPATGVAAATSQRPAHSPFQGAQARSAAARGRQGQLAAVAPAAGRHGSQKLACAHSCRPRAAAPNMAHQLPLALCLVMGLVALMAHGAAAQDGASLQQKLNLVNFTQASSSCRKGWTPKNVGVRYSPQKVPWCVWRAARSTSARAAGACA